MRVGNVVTVSGRVDIACTAAANTLTTLGISLPLASNLATVGQLGGTAVGGATGQNEACAIAPDVTNDRAQLSFYSTMTASRAFLFTFQYVVV
jgi:hypothetical protein